MKDDQRMFLKCVNTSCVLKYNHRVHEIFFTRLRVYFTLTRISEENKMAIFDKNSISNIEYDWFKNKLDTNFCIPDDHKSKVIFGFNGIGKTTIFRCIKEKNNSNIEYLEYFELKDTLTNGKKTLIISPNINQIVTLRNQIEPLKLSLNEQKILKDAFGFSKKGDATAFGARVQTAWVDKSFPGFAKNKTDIQAIESKLNGIPPKAFIDSFPEIRNVHSAQQELQSEKDHTLFHILSSLDTIVENTDINCPICGNPAINLKQTIQTKMNTLNNRESALIEKMKKHNVPFDATAINNIVDAYNLTNNDPELKADYVLCGGNSSVFDSISQNYIQLMALESQIIPLETQARSSYNNIKNEKNPLQQDLKKYFGVDATQIVYDDAKFTITVTFPRDLKKYSTGELNLISFLYRIYSFIGSDKTVLLLDDPVSSLDLINHYKIAYEIVRNATTKTLIVLTHSVEFINVINSQFPGNPKFEYYYLEQSNGVISLNPIPVNTSVNNPNIISLDKLSDPISFRGFIDAIRKRETDTTNVAIQTLFHYSAVAVHLDGDLSKFSNHDLLSLIANFLSFTQTDFYYDSYIKIQHLCALRVWLEMKLYSLIPPTDVSLQNKFINKDTLNEKIECILPRNGVPTVAVPAGLTRDILMSKKVMLNQGVHYYSQIMPFAYAISLSLDMLKDEILELKTLLP